MEWKNTELKIIFRKNFVVLDENCHWLKLLYVGTYF
jgi:hypothetical protein